MRWNWKELRLLSVIIAIWGVISIGTGLSLKKYDYTITKTKYTVKISSNQQTQAQSKKNEIKLKNIEIEVGNPISTNAKDYIENIEDFSDLLLRQLSETLDTSLVNINQPGNYKYTITYKKKKYEGIITIMEKEVPNVTFTLKAKIMPTTGTLSRNKKDYIYEELDEEIYNNMILDLREVESHQSIPGKYKYTITFKDTVYYGDFEIVEDVVTNKVVNACPSDAIVDNMNKTCVCKESNKKYDEETKTCIEQETEEITTEEKRALR